MKLDWLRPNIAKSIAFVVAVLIPFLRERAPAIDGSISVAYYSVGLLLGSYLYLADWFPFFQMLAFAIVIYVAIAGIIDIISQIIRKK